MLIQLLFAVIALPVIAALYVIANVWLVHLLLRHGQGLFQTITASIQRQVDNVSTIRIWMTFGLYVVTSAVAVLFLRQQLSLIAICTVLFLLIFLTSAWTLSLLESIPFFKRLWNDPVAKLSMIALPVAIMYVARGYANVWISDLLGISAANVGFTAFAATAFLLCLVAAILLMLVSALMEFAMFIAVMAVSPKKGGAKAGRAWGLALLTTSSFLATIFSAKAAIQFPGSPLGNIVLSAIAFEFDANSAGRCQLNTDETKFADGLDPYIKAIHLSTTQEKAILIQRSPALFGIGTLKDIQEKRDGAREVTLLRVTDCFSKN